MGDRAVPLSPHRRLGAPAAAALIGVAAGVAILFGSSTGHAFESSLVCLILAAAVAGWCDQRAALFLFAASFFAVANPALRLQVGPLMVPAPAWVGGMIYFRELVRRWALRLPLFEPIPVLPLGLLFVGFLASGLAVVRPSAYFAELVKWIGHIVVFLAMILALQKVRWVRGLADGLGFPAAALAAAGLWRIYSGLSHDIDVFEGIGTRAAASFLFTAMLPLVYARLGASGFAGGLLRAVLFGLLVTAQVFTYTRAGWVASTVGLLFVAGKRVRTYLGIGLTAGILIWAAPQDVRDRFLSIFIVRDFGVDPRFASSTVAREYLLLTGLQMLKSHWLLGVGLGNYWDQYYGYAVPGSPAGAKGPHNSYLLLWAQGGITSLVAFLWLYASRIALLARTWKKADGSDGLLLRGLAGSLVAMAVEGCFEDDLNVLVMWTLLGMATAMAQRCLESRN